MLQLALDDWLDGIAEQVLSLRVEQDHVRIGEHVHEWVQREQALHVESYVLELFDLKLL